VVGIYLLGSGHRALAALLRARGELGRHVVIGHELTPHTRAALLAGHLDAVIAQNPGHLARSALRVLRAKAERQPIDEGQERLRIEVVIRENLPPESYTATF
jgi:LacI family transcriptional regulator